jgi:hypothetical protein
MANVGLTSDFGRISYLILGLQIVHEFQYQRNAWTFAKEIKGRF